MSRVRIPSPAPITTTPSHSGGCCCICDIDGGFELSGKRVRLQARNGRSMSESRWASGRRDFAFSVRRMSASGFIFAVRRAGVAGFVLPAMRAKCRGINMRTPLHPLFLTPSHSGGGVVIVTLMADLNSWERGVDCKRETDGVCRRAVGRAGAGTLPFLLGE